MNANGLGGGGIGTVVFMCGIYRDNKRLGEGGRGREEIPDEETTKKQQVKTAATRVYTFTV